jgi:acyl-CoA thioesterase
VTLEAPRSPFLELVGVELDEAGEGYVRYSLKLEERHTNPNGIMHGGVLTSMMDEAAGHAIVTLRGLEAMAAAPHATVEMNVSFMAADPARR